MGVRKAAFVGAVVAAVAALAPVSALAQPGAAAAAKVTVTLSDKQFVVSPPHLEAGTATVVVVNRAQKLHVLTIIGPGLHGGRTERVAAGKTATLTVKFSTGAYQVADSAVRSGVRWLVVSPATVVKSSGNGSVTVPLTDPSRMECD